MPTYYRSVGKDNTLEQAPATKSFQRFSNLLLARLRLLRYDNATNIKTSEKVALALRQHPNSQNSVASHVIFLLPLVRKSQVSDWGMVEKNLNKTLSSFVAQTNENWQAIICGQDRPNMLVDSRVRFHPFKTEIQGNDKWAKLENLVQLLPAITQRCGYVMTFDADDLAHNDLVKTFLSSQSKTGYLIDHGIVHDVSAETYGQAGHATLTKPLRKPFWKLCGSCSAFRYTTDEQEIFVEFMRKLVLHEHRMFPYLAELSGRKLARLTSNLICYEINHGQGFDTRLGQGRYKLKFVKRFAIKDPLIIRKIKSSYG
jgi:hypothetical protein